jgi:hypothetical protein
MITLDINSRKLGKTLTFSKVGFYLYVNLNGQHGYAGQQLCYGGRTLGHTIGFDGDDEQKFERIVRTWYRAYIKD